MVIEATRLPKPAASSNAAPAAMAQAIPALVLSPAPTKKPGAGLVLPTGERIPLRGPLDRIPSDSA
jgi:hypothetical protein